MGAALPLVTPSNAVDIEKGDGAEHNGLRHWGYPQHDGGVNTSIHARYGSIGVLIPHSTPLTTNKQDKLILVPIRVELNYQLLSFVDYGGLFSD